MATEDPRIVLMADDDEEDCFLAKAAFEASGAPATFSSVKDGIELMEYLTECSHSGQGRLPALILLDLNMPRKDGRTALLEMKADPAFQNIPIVILTTSEEEEDRSFSMRGGAKSFITKPATFDEWVEIMRSLPTFFGLSSSCSAKSI